MVDLGIKHKDLYEKPSAGVKDYDNEVQYPELSVSGKLAERMGAAVLQEGESVEVPVVLRVKRHTTTQSGGKTEYSMTLCLVKMGDMTETDLDDDLDEELPDRPPGALAALSSYEEPE